MIFIFPTEMEAALFQKAAPASHIEICGGGLAEAAANISAIISRSTSDQELVLCGIAGSYCAQNLATGEVVEVTKESIEALPHAFAKEYIVSARTSLRTVSSNSVNSSSQSSHTADIENMEGAAFMALCSAHKRRGVQIRAISNIVAEPFHEWRTDEAIERLTHSIIEQFLS